MDNKDIILTIVWVVGLSPIWGALLFSVWTGDIQPRLIPSKEIEDVALEYIEKYGNEAAKRAFTNEYRAWRYSKSCEQGRWKRIRREIYRQTES
ncbi:MAG: hypothetical protein COB24_13875 [Hyphomicrobiales bacterium]|nr:MAG: hypothetical protein COB24_13875 [Hyphomicrobiales bacterium]